MYCCQAGLGLRQGELQITSCWQHFNDIFFMFTPKLFLKSCNFFPTGGPISPTIHPRWISREWPLHFVSNLQLQLVLGCSWLIFYAKVRFHRVISWLHGNILRKFNKHLKNMDLKWFFVSTLSEAYILIVTALTDFSAVTMTRSTMRGSDDK